MTPQEWLQQELQKSFYSQMDIASIWHYLNAPRVTKEPNPDPQKTVPVVLSVAEIIPLVQPSEWRAIRSPETSWTAVSDAAIEAGEALGGEQGSVVIQAAMAVDTALLDTFGPEAITLLQAVSGVLGSHDAGLAQALIATLVMAKRLGQKSATALQAAMMKPDPDWQPVLYSVEPSIWQAATGLQRNVAQEEIQEALT